MPVRHILVERLGQDRLNTQDGFVNDVIDFPKNSGVVDAILLEHSS